MAFGAAAQQNSKSIFSVQPLWGPMGHNLASYYYLPDIETYYDIPQKKFIYWENNQWQFSSTLPERFKDYDLFKGYKVVLNRPHPYYNFEAHKARYDRFKGQLNRQVSIQESTSPKYFVVEGHPKGPQMQASEPKHSDSNLKVAGN